MSDIVAVKRVKKKRTKTERLWQQAARLRQSNDHLKAALDNLVLQIQREIVPQEKALAESQIPLGIKLLKLGQRKSLTNRERDTLHGWVMELFEDLQAFDLIDNDLRNHLARYDAFRLGLDLDESEEPHVALNQLVEQQALEAQRQREIEAQQQAEADQHERAQMLDQGKQKIEQALDSVLGPRPEHEADKTDDLFADELKEEIVLEQQLYDQQRKALREEMLADLYEDIDLLFDENDDILDAEEFERLFEEHLRGTQHNDAYTPTDRTDKQHSPMDDSTLQKLFRATAAKLHPDRERDPALRDQKQRLMVSLLKARKRGDIVTIIELYNTWVGSGDVLSDGDQQALYAALEHWLVMLEREKQQIISESPIHFHAYHEYYDQSQRMTDRAIRQRINAISRGVEANQKLSAAITTIKSLKPWLSDRYEQGRWALGY